MMAFHERFYGAKPISPYLFYYVGVTESERGSVSAPPPRRSGTTLGSSILGPLHIGADPLFDDNMPFSMLTLPQIVRLKEWVSMNPHVNQGQPTVRGTAITVAELLEAMRAGRKIEGVSPEACQAIWRELGEK